MSFSDPRNSLSSRVTLVLSNLLPLLGVLYLEWNIFDILVIYWAETGVIMLCGFIKAARNGLRLSNAGALLPAAATLGFMAIHYLFLYIAGIFMSEIHRNGAALTLLEPLTQRPAIWSSLLVFTAARLKVQGIIPDRPVPLSDFETLFSELLAPRIALQTFVILIAFGIGLTGRKEFFLAVAALVGVKTVMELLVSVPRKGGGEIKPQ